MSLLYVDSRGVDERVDLAECLATNQPGSNHPPVCYLALPQGVNSFDLEVTGRPFKGEEVKTALAGRQSPGTNYEQSRAYTNYIRRLQSGTSGFTCFASLQMPRG